MTVTGTHLFEQNRQFFDDYSRPLSGGTVKFTRAGTNTLQDTFSDQALTTPNPNPVTLNGAGRFADPNTGEPISMYVDPSKTFKIRVQDSDGVDVKGWPLDNVSALGFDPVVFDEVQLTSDDTAGGVTIDSNKVALPIKTIFKRNRMLLSQFSPDDGIDYGDGVHNVYAILDKAAKYTAANRYILFVDAPTNFYRLHGTNDIRSGGSVLAAGTPGIRFPSFSQIECADRAVFRQDWQDAGGTLFGCADGSSLLPGHDAVFENFQVDGQDLPYDTIDPTFSVPVYYGTNAFGFAGRLDTGTFYFSHGLRIIGGHIQNYKGQFKRSGGPGGKAINCGEEGIYDCIIDGVRIENCMYATFVSPTLDDNSNPNRKYVTNIRYVNMDVDKCGCAFQWFCDDTGTGDNPPSDTGINSVYWEGRVKDSGHMPDNTPGSGGFANVKEKSAPFIVFGGANVEIHATVKNGNGYPNATYPAGNYTDYPTSYPPIGGTTAGRDSYVGGGLSGNTGAVLWGWGRNLKARIRAFGNFDDLWNFSSPRAWSGVFAAFGKQYAQGAFNQDVVIEHAGNALSAIRTGYPNITGTAVSATANTLTLPVSVRPLRGNELLGLRCFIIAGTGLNQSQEIFGYNATSGVLTFGAAFAVTPDNTSKFYIGSVIASGTSVDAVDGAGGSITLPSASRINQDNYFVDAFFIPTKGAGAGQILLCDDYISATGVFSFSTVMSPLMATSDDWLIAVNIRPKDTDISATVTMTVGALAEPPIHESCNIYNNIVSDIRNGGAVGAFGTRNFGSALNALNGYNTLSGGNGELIIPGRIRPRITGGKNDYSLADDTALALIVAGHTQGKVYIHSNTSTLSHDVWYRANTTPHAETVMYASGSDSTSFAVNDYGANPTGVLAGTTGANNCFTVSADASGNLYFENRRGVTVSFSLRFED